MVDLVILSIFTLETHKMNNYKITHRKKKDPKTVQLVYSGELSFNHIQSIYEETKMHFKTNSQTEIVIEDADLLDLSFIQMIISLKKVYPVKVILNLSEDLLELIQVSGFYKYLIEENSSNGKDHFIS